jgi:hypothetical protein
MIIVSGGIMITKKIALFALGLAIFLPNIAFAEQDVIINDNNSTVKVRNGDVIIGKDKQQSSIDDKEETGSKNEQVKAGNVKITTDKNGNIQVDTGNSKVKTDSIYRTSVRRNNRRLNINRNNPADSVTKNETTTNTTTKKSGNTTIIKKGNSTVINSQVTCGRNNKQSTQSTKIVGSGKKVIQQNTSVFKCP